MGTLYNPPPEPRSIGKNGEGKEKGKGQEWERKKERKKKSKKGERGQGADFHLTHAQLEQGRRLAEASHDVGI